jgi:hypothetical protein
MIVILKKLCSFVGADFGKIDFSSNNWFMKHEWDSKQEEEFCEWMVKYLYDNATARKDITSCRKNKMQLRKVARYFVFQYGWKYSK